jgi:putative redox protein
MAHRYAPFPLSTPIDQRIHLVRDEARHAIVLTAPARERAADRRHQMSGFPLKWRSGFADCEEIHSPRRRWIPRVSDTDRRRLEYSMTIFVIRDRTRKMMHTVSVREHAFAVDEPEGNGGEDAGPTPHDLYDSALGSCKALTVLWYADRKRMPLEDIRVTVDRDDSEERKGVYRLRVTLSLGGPLSDAQRHELLAVAEKCPVHKLMTQVSTEILTLLAPVPT